MTHPFRSPAELRALASAQGITATLHPTGQPMPTVELAAAALGIAVESMTKNIVCLIDTQPVLVIAAGQSRIDDRALAQHFGLSRKKVGLARPEQAYDVSGFVVGCMPSFGHRTQLPTFIDPAVIVLPRVYGGTGDPAVLISLATTDLLALTGGTVLAVTR